MMQALVALLDVAVCNPVGARSDNVGPCAGDGLAAKKGAQVAQAAA